MSGRFIAVVGPSGVGKDSVMAALAKAQPDLFLARRAITRPGEAGGEDFDGISEAAFLRLEAEGAFALSWAAHGLHYGIPIAVEMALAEGRDVLANLSRSMLTEAKMRFARFEVLSLTASPDVLADRLWSRGRETEAEITARLARADHALPDHIAAIGIDNSGPLKQTVAQALAALYPERAAR
ncbi:phosphonate metabolism protein/1,5-bisphosphokinase (PRPP-forming) PhnN [uncultured Sulfitobacter sp.]|uniref:phosphonate metabolism protein/1,5-bisphosphokinase (PRPP-forming) PhnN n=1 Tax=uncultured Sulfitobacter sp. TaxID=191468 RepID=UPI0030DD68EB